MKWFKHGEVPQQPTCPALAHGIVASLLPRIYFHVRPPRSGWRFDVTGEDGRPTSWFVPDQYAHQLNQQLRAHRHITAVHCEPYDDTKESAA